MGICLEKGKRMRLHQGKDTMGPIVRVDVEIDTTGLVNEVD